MTANVEGNNGKMKVLCFHGYRQNSEMFRQKSGALRKALKNIVEFEFISAPLEPNLSPSKNGSDESNGPRAWWFSRVEGTFSSKEETEIADGFDKSVEFVRRHLREKGPFHGLLGFSQGASLVHLLLASRLPELAHIRFVILFSAFKSLSAVHRPLLTVRPLLDIPSFHVYGLADEVVLSSRSEELAREHFASASTVIVTHPGRHCIPPPKEFKEQLLRFLEQFSSCD